MKISYLKNLLQNLKLTSLVLQIKMKIYKKFWIHYIIMKQFWVIEILHILKEMLTIGKEKTKNL